jgi:hypothetical protein
MNMATNVVQTVGEIRPTWMAELVADPAREDRLRLLYWDGQVEQIRERLALTLREGADPTIYEPAEIHPNVLRAITFPDHAADYGTRRELFESVCSAIRKFIALPEESVALVGHAVLASWVVESTEVPVCLALVGPAGPERRQLLRLLRCLFRRALALSGVNLAGLSALPMNLTPSLLIEHCEPNAALQTFLRATSSPEAHVTARGQLLNLCCTKVVCLDDPLDPSLRDLPILEIPLMQSESALPMVDHRAQRELLEEFQPKLLKFRLTNLARVRESRIDPTDLRVPWRDIAGCLSASVAGDGELQPKVTELIKKQQTTNQLQSEKFFKVAVVEALVRLCHQAKENDLTVGQIAHEANVVMEEKGEILSLRPRAVGNILRVLGIPTEGLGARGRGIILLRNLRNKVHDMATDHGINPRLTKPGGCEICLAADIEEDVYNTF